MTTHVRAQGAGSRSRGTSEVVLFTLDSARLARAFALVVGLAFVIGAFLAVGLAVRPIGDASAQSADDLRRLYSLHGLVMVFLVAVPVVPAVFGNALLPRLLGLEGMAWPRANLLSFQLFLVGFLVFVTSAVVAPSDAGWSLDTPFSLTHGSGLWWMGVGISILCAATLCSCANLVATFWSGEACRANAPRNLFTWSLVVGSLAQAAAAIVLAGALFLLLAERAGASSLWTGRVEPSASFASWFALAMNGALGATIVFALGLASEVVEGGRGVRRRADTTAVACLAAAAVASFAGFGVHLPGRDASLAGAVGSSALALASGIPFVILFARFWHTLADGSVQLGGAVSWAIAGLALSCTGGVAAVALAVLPTSVWLEHTSYATGVTHLLFAGGVVSVALAGIHHVWRDWFDVEPPQGTSRLACVLYFVGANLAFLPQLVLGVAGVARRGGPSIAGDAVWNNVSAAGGLVLGAALILVGWNLTRSVMSASGATSDVSGKGQRS